MSFYEIDFTYKIEEYGTVTLEADDSEQAEEFGREYIKETYTDVMDIQIDEVKVIER